MVVCDMLKPCMQYRKLQEIVQEFARTTQDSCKNHAILLQELWKTLARTMQRFLQENMQEMFKYQNKNL